MQPPLDRWIEDFGADLRIGALAASDLATQILRGEATHTGGNLFGTGPTGRIVTRVMDFYDHGRGHIRENWVPMDDIHRLGEMGVDVFARTQSHFRRGRWPQ